MIPLASQPVLRVEKVLVVYSREQTDGRVVSSLMSLRVTFLFFFFENLTVTRDLNKGVEEHP